MGALGGSPWAAPFRTGGQFNIRSPSPRVPQAFQFRSVAGVQPCMPREGCFPPLIRHRIGTMPRPPSVQFFPCAEAGCCGCMGGLGIAGQFFHLCTVSGNSCPLRSLQRGDRHQHLCSRPVTIVAQPRHTKVKHWCVLVACSVASFACAFHFVAPWLVVVAVALHREDTATTGASLQQKLLFFEVF